MASISRVSKKGSKGSSKGRQSWRIRVTLGGRQREFIVSGVTQRGADQIGEHCDRLVKAATAGQPVDQYTAEWLGRIGDELHGKLARLGLVPERKAAEAPHTLQELVEAFIEARPPLAESTADKEKDIVAHLYRHFPKDIRLDGITAADARQFRNKLGTEPKQRGKGGYAFNTVRRICGRAKQIFRFGVEKEWLKRNPFEVLRGCQVRANRERMQHVERDTVLRVIDSVPDTDIRVLLGLTRFAGLRIGEAVDLRWSDVDLIKNRLQIRCSKTQHHDGRSMRMPPIFPELRLILSEASRVSGKDAYVVKRYRSTDAARMQVKRLVRAAGIAPWPKTFQNLRSSCETDWASIHLPHLVFAWIGHTEKVAQEHYLQVTEDHYAAAAEGRPTLGQGFLRRPAAHETGSPSSGTLKSTLAIDCRPAHSGESGNRSDTRGRQIHLLAKLCDALQPAAGDKSSPSRARTYNLAVNSRSLYH